MTWTPPPVTTSLSSPLISMRCLSLLCLTFLTGAYHLSAQDTAVVASVPVVRTWGDLGKLAPTRLANGSEIRLGVQALEGSVGSAVAVYVLTVHGTPINQVTSAAVCGPVGIQVGDDPHALQQVEQQFPLEPGRLNLYAYLVPLSQSGPVLISILDQGNIVIAQVTITAQETGYHAWATVLHCSSEAIPIEEAGEDAAEDGIILMDKCLNLGPNIAAVPTADGYAPWSHIRAALLQNILTNPKDDLALPIPEPTAPHALLQAQATATGVTLTLPARLLPDLDQLLVTEHLLARWWKNGEPWTPPVSPFADPSYEVCGGYGIPNPTDRYRLELHFYTEEWPRDRIEVQFLLSSGGYTSLQEDMRVDRAELAKRMNAQEELGLPMPGTVLSPRITLLPR